MAFIACLAVQAQDTSIDKGAGILYFSDTPGTTPNTTCCSEVALNTTTGEMWVWNRTGTAWERQVNITEGTGAPSGDPGSAPKLYLRTDTGQLYRWTGAAWEEIGSGGGGSAATNIAFDGDRNILRVPTSGDNIGTDSLKQWLEWWYFAPPTITLGSLTGVVEIGTSNSLTLAGATTNPGGATLSLGDLRQTSPSSVSINAFGAATSYTSPITWTPTQGGAGAYDGFTYSFRASQAWAFGSESGTVNSPTRTVTAVYPVFYGVSATDFSSSGNIYGTLTKLVESEGDKSNLNMNGTGFSYIAIPKTWGDFDLSVILDHNGFDVTSSYTAYDITVTSSGLTNDWTAVTYKLYKFNNSSTYVNYTYSFTR